MSWLQSVGDLGAQVSGIWVITGINPEPWTAPEVSIGRRGGKLAPQVFKREALRSFQEALHDYIKDNYDPEPFSGDLAVRYHFWRALETSRSKVADATNLQKAAEDALHGLLFLNDRQVKDVRSGVVMQMPDIEPAIVIQWHHYEGAHDPDALAARKKELERISKLPPPDNDTNLDVDRIF